MPLELAACCLGLDLAFKKHRPSVLDKYGYVREALLLYFVGIIQNRSGHLLLRQPQFPRLRGIVNAEPLQKRRKQATILVQDGRERMRQPILWLFILVENVPHDPTAFVTCSGR